MLSTTQGKCARQPPIDMDMNTNAGISTMYKESSTYKKGASAGHPYLHTSQAQAWDSGDGQFGPAKQSLSGLADYAPNPWASSNDVSLGSSNSSSQTSESNRISNGLITDDYLSSPLPSVSPSLVQRQQLPLSPARLHASEESLSSNNSNLHSVSSNSSGTHAIERAAGKHPSLDGQHGIYATNNANSSSRIPSGGSGLDQDALNKDINDGNHISAQETSNSIDGAIPGEQVDTVQNTTSMLDNQDDSPSSRQSTIDYGSTGDVRLAREALLRQALIQQSYLKDQMMRVFQTKSDYRQQSAENRLLHQYASNLMATTKRQGSQGGRGV
ncbi:hypothetical protein BASA83_005265 [Batrachochytrium salamandrivorans]|nr:hypothetical protein BASA81_013314 [Batrachochytrium salamandrivorans]KAH9272458.1 hypothetical protein BASA83_005265 [Batrachochytrium salamandrivorans]